MKALVYHGPNDKSWDEVPDAALLTATGAPTTLAQVLGGSPAVLVFYRGGWCPYCNVALRSYQAELLPQLEGLGVKMVAISPQRPDSELQVDLRGHPHGHTRHKQRSLLRPRNARCRPRPGSRHMDVPLLLL